MLDRDRILTKIDELDGYLRELRQVVPAGFAEYLAKVEARRACERLLQISIQSLLDICHLFVAGLRLGLPAEEDDMLSKIEQAKVFAPEILQSLRTMKGFRNILVHEYGGVDNAIVFKAATARLRDFEACKHRHASSAPAARSRSPVTQRRFPADSERAHAQRHRINETNQPDSHTLRRATQ